MVPAGSRECDGLQNDRGSPQEKGILGPKVDVDVNPHRRKLVMGDEWSVIGIKLPITHHRSSITPSDV